MAKSETKETYKQSKKYAEGAAGDYAPLTAASQARAAGGQENTGLGGLQNEITEGYRNMASTPAERYQARSIGNVGSTDVSDLKSSIEGYKAFRDTGGLSAENMERMRGMGGFDEFAKTGGYTPESIANIKAQALNPIGSYATGTRDELARRTAVQGGYAPGFDAASRQLRRDTSRAIADTSLNANVAIQDRVNAGRQWGIGGVAQSEGALAGMQTGNRLAALGGETTAGGHISQASAQDRANELAVAQYNAAQGDYADRFNIENSQSQRAAGLGGLTGMYGLGAGMQQGEYDRQLAIQNAMQGARGNYLGNQTQLAVQPGIGGNLVSLAGSAAGIAGGMMTGGAGNLLSRTSPLGINAGGYGLQAPGVGASQM